MIDSLGTTESCILCDVNYTLVSGSCELITSTTSTLDYYVFSYSGYLISELTDITTNDGLTVLTPFKFI